MEAVNMSPLPAECSILANKEPFKGGDWRKTPYIPRYAAAAFQRASFCMC